MIKFGFSLNKSHWMRDVKKGAQPVIASVTTGIAERMRLLMRQPKTGREYKKRQRTTGQLIFDAFRIHRASAPGEAPAVDEGNLIRSIGVRIVSALKGIVTVADKKASYLEEGTARMAARPYVAPSVEGVIADYNKRGILGALDL